MEQNITKNGKILKYMPFAIFVAILFMFIINFVLLLKYPPILIAIDIIMFGLLFLWLYIFFTGLQKEMLDREKEYLEKANWYVNILDSIPFPLSVTDNKLNWTFINAATERLLNVKRADVLGQPCKNWGSHICGTENCGIYCLRRGNKITFFDQEGSHFQVDSNFLYDTAKTKVGQIEVVQDITKFFESQHTIDKVKAVHTSMMDFSPIAFFLVSFDKRIIFANKYATEIFGLEIGAYDTLFSINSESNDVLLSIKNSPSKYNQVVKLRTKSGAIRRYNIVGDIINYDSSDCYLIWVSDIESLENQRDLLVKSREDLENIVDTLPIPIFVTREDCETILFANKEYLNKFWGKEFNMEVMNPTAILPEFQSGGAQSLDYANDYIKHVLASNTMVVAEFDCLMHDGRVIQTKNIAKRISYGDEMAAMVIIDDITQQKEHATMLMEAARKEKDANMLKSKFLMTMSHEIKTPMNAIIGLSEIEINKKHPDIFNEPFKKINGSAKILLAIINDILDFSKIETEKLDIIEEEFDLEETLRGALFMASQRIEDNNVEIFLKTDFDLPTVVYGDKTRVWQILKNILDNSGKFTQRGSIRLEAIKLSDNDKVIKVKFVVTDTGMGIPKEVLEHLYTPFEQFHNRVINTTGTGLGMAITKQLVELMGGNITVESTVGVGTITTVILPFKRVSSPTFGQSIRTNTLKGKNVLIVDDEPISVEIVSSLLKEAGATCVIARSRAEALVEATKVSNFDIVIIDYILGDSLGTDVAQELNMLLSPQIKFLMVSAYARKMLREDVRNLGFFDLVDKPFMPTAFIEKVCAALEINKMTNNEVKSVSFPEARILVVEDNFTNQEVADGMLETFKIKAEFAENGEEAIRMLEAKEYDLVFMDIMMPIMDGHECTVAIRNSGKAYSQIPIVALTANAMKSEVDKCFGEGMNGHISKPVEFDKILQSLLKWLPENLHEYNSTPR